MRNEFVKTLIKRCLFGDHEFDPYLILVILSDWVSIPCHNDFAEECDVDRFVLILWSIEFLYEKSCISLDSCGGLPLKSSSRGAVFRADFETA